jgi:hypothetical protein
VQVARSAAIGSRSHKEPAAVRARGIAGNTKAIGRGIFAFRENAD